MTKVILISLLFGMSQKLADALNEHGTVLFKRANILFGIIFGITGALLISLNSTFAEFYLALVMYWLVAGKLDFFNHQLASAIMITVAFAHIKEFSANTINIVFVVIIFFVFKGLKKYLSILDWRIKLLFDKKLHHFLIAIIFGLWFSNFLVSISIIFTIFGIVATINTLKHFNNYNNCSF